MQINPNSSNRPKKARRRLKMAYILIFLITLIGGNLVTQFRSDKDHLFHKKLSYIGVFCAVFHTSLTIYCDHISQGETDDDPDTFIAKNNIIRATEILGRWITLLFGPGHAVTSILQSPALCGYLNYLEEFDVFLASHKVNVEVIRRKMVSIDRTIAFLMIFMTFFNFSMIYVLYSMYYEVVPEAFNIYLDMLPVTSFLLQYAIACLHLKAVSIRVNGFVDILESICKDFEGCKLVSNNRVRRDRLEGNSYFL